MGKQIDERVVEMRFDNGDFMRKVKPTIASLDELKKSLQLENAAKSFDNIQKSAQQVDMSGLGRTLDGVREKFSALEAIGVGALMKIGSQVVSLGERLVSSFGLGPILDGYREYELKLNSVQTIMNATGESLETVNTYLDDLNTYADKTIYSFSDMTNAIGKFTNAGVDLKLSTEAIKGVSNATAFAGLGADAASSAFYNFAQALSTGYLGMQDYRSVGMTFPIVNKRFQKELVQTALDMGTLVDAGDKYVTTTTNAQGRTAELNKDLGAFQYSLNAQWVTSDVLIKTLAKYSDETTELGKQAAEAATQVKTFTQLVGTVKEAIGSGWAKTWELAFGDLEEAKKLWTGVNNVISAFVDRQSDARNNLINMWKAYGGIGDVYNGIANAGKAMLKVLGPIAEAFHEVFALNPKNLKRISQGFEEFTKWLIISDKASSSIKITFKALFKVIKAGLGIVGKEIQLFASVAKVVIDFVVMLIEGIDGLTNKFKNSEKGQKILENISKILEKLGKVGTRYLDEITQKADEFSEAIRNLIPLEVGSLVDGFLDAIEDITFELSKIDFNSPVKQFDGLTAALGRLVSKFTGNESLNEYIKNLAQYLSNMSEAFTLENFPKNISQLADYLKNISTSSIKSVKGINESAVSEFKNFEDSFSVFVEWVKEKMGPLNDLLSGVSLGGVAVVGGEAGIIYAILKVAKAFEEGAKKLESLPKIFNQISDVLKGYQDKLKAERLEKISKSILILSAALVILSFADMSKVAQAATALAGIAAALTIGTSKLLTALNRSKDIKDAAYMFGKSMNNLAKSVKWKAIGSAVKDFGKTIIMIAGSIIAIALFYEKYPDATKEAAKLVGEIGLAIVAMVTTMEFVSSKIEGGSKSIATVGVGVLALSSALYIAIKAIEKIFALEIPGDYGKKLAILAGVFLGLIVVAKSVNKSSVILGKGEKLKSGTSQILAMAIFLYAAVSALNKLFKMELPVDYRQKLVIMAGLFVGLGYIAKTIGKASRDAQGSLKAFGTIIAMAIFMGVAVSAMSKLTELDGDKLAEAAIVFGGVLIALAESIKRVSKEGGTSKGSYKDILSMAVLIAAVAFSLGALTFIDTEKLLFSTIALGAVLLALGKCMETMKDLEFDTNLLGGVVAGIIMLVGAAVALAILASQPWEGILAAGVAMTLVVESYSRLAKMLSSRIGLHAKKVGVFFEMILATIPIWIALGVLSTMPWDGLLAAGVAMSLTTLAFVGALKILSSVDSKNYNADTFLMIIGLIVPMIAIAGALAVLANQPWEGILAGAVALSTVLVTMTGILAVCAAIGSKAEAARKSIGNLMLLMIPLAAVTAALWVLTSDKTGGGNAVAMIAAGQALKTAMEGMGEVLLVVTAMGMLAPGVVAGAGALVVAVGAITGLLVALGAIFQIDGLDKLLNGGAEVLGQIGTAIGTFVGNIVGGAMAGVSSGFPAVAANLSKFAVNLMPFITTLKLIKSDQIESAKSLVSLILTLTAASFLNGISSFMSFITGGNSLDKFSEQIDFLVPAIQTFAEGTKGVNTTKVKEGADALLALFTAFSKIPNSGGFLGKIMGENTISEEYAENIGHMGEGLRKFSIYAAQVSKSSVIDSSEALISLFTAFSKIPNSGGLLGDLAGNNDISKSYAQSIAAMGGGLNKFSFYAEQVNVEAVKASAGAMQTLFFAFRDIPNSGGLLGAIMGENDISKEYGQNMVAMGDYLNTYSFYAEMVNVTAVMMSAIAMKALFNAFADIPNSGGLISWFTGDNDISTFASGLKDFGQALAEYSKITEGINFSTMSATTTQITRLVELADSISKMDNIYGLSDFISSFAFIGNGCINNFTAAFQNAHDDVKAAIEGVLKVITDTVGDWESKFETYGKDSATAILTGVSSTVENGQVSETATNFIEQFMTVIAIYMVVFATKGMDAADNFISGFTDKEPKAHRAGISLATEAIDGLNMIVPTFFNIGAQAGQGVVDGLLSKLEEVRKAAKALADAASGSASSALDEHSPSKVFEKIGVYADLGLIGGLRRLMQQVAIAGYDVGETASDSANEGVRQIQTALDTDFETGIIITPTFDLSNARLAADDINRMFNKSIENTAIMADSINGNVKAIKGEVTTTTPNGDVTTNGSGNTYIFTQNNTSPKALSRIEIYRQTKNQFANFRREVEKAR